MIDDKDERTILDVVATVVGVILGFGICVVIWKVFHP